MLSVTMCHLPSLGSDCARVHTALSPPNLIEQPGSAGCMLSFTDKDNWQLIDDCECCGMPPLLARMRPRQAMLEEPRDKGSSHH